MVQKTKYVQRDRDTFPSLFSFIFVLKDCDKCIVMD